MMLFDKAQSDFESGIIDELHYAKAWLEEFKFCYKKHGGRVNHFIRFATPCHWAFGIMDHNATPTTMWGTSRGVITIPASKIHPEIASRAVIAYEALTVLPEGMEGKA